MVSVAVPAFDRKLSSYVTNEVRRLLCSELTAVVISLFSVI
jgi:hypothetical protein